MTRSPALHAAVAAALFLAACGGDDNSPPPSENTTQDYITAVSATVGAASARTGLPRFVDGIKLKPQTVQRFSLVMPPVTAVYYPGTPPASSGGLTAQATPNSTPLLGQPFRYLVAASGAFTIVYLAVDDLDGYWQLTLPSGVDQLELVITLANTPPSTDFQLRSILGYEGGVSQPITLRVQPGDLSQSDIAATLRWTGASDVDLHIIDGKGQEVAWDSPTTPEGGRLDLDSNPACEIDNVNQEIISWPAGGAPAGGYRVFVQYYDDCGIPSSAYNVTLAVKNRAVQTFSGTFTGAGGPAVADTVARITWP